ncbi:MAG: ribose-phosphate diphosphokinase [Eubacteriales bacterium]|nr:ribose-phosphate diphosphokinase [Eubacteriales bacterium]
MESDNIGWKSFKFWRYGENTMQPVGPIGIITHQLNRTFADNINSCLRRRRENYVQDYPELLNYPAYLRKDYRIEVDLTRFRTGEGKAKLLDDVRGHDLFIITDVINNGTYMTRYSQTISLSPDDQYMDLIRLISATQGVAARINVIMPYLYEGRRYLRQSRQSTDCAVMLRQLFSFGISNFITYDAHDGRVANAVPRHNFENFPTALQIIERMLEVMPDLQINSDKFMVVSPSETSISRAIYYATMMRVPLGTFYRIHERDDAVERGFLGDDVSGRDVIIVDDLFDTGEAILACANYLKEHGARRVIAVATFPLFSNGLLSMNQAYDYGIIDKVFATNLIRIPRALFDAPWFVPVDMSENLASVIDAANHEASISKLLAPDARIHEILHKYSENLQA